MGDYTEYKDEELIQMHRAGQAGIFDVIMERYKPLIRKKTNMLFLIGGEKDDLIQEGMIGLFKAVSDYDPSHNASFFTFADMCITRQLSTALEASNRKKHQPLNEYVSFSSEEGEDGATIEQLATDEANSPEALVLSQEFTEEFQQKLTESLSPMETEVFALQMEGNDLQTIARLMDKDYKSIDNTSQRIRHKVKKLKEYFT